ncbi:ABC transporter [Kutzneria sp. 744]|nr:ABC transporter [Kutzneria sp. 744]
MDSWMLMRGAMARADTPKQVRRGTLRRVLEFARPHWGKLAWFLGLTVVDAFLAVSTPVLAGRVVDGIINKTALGVVIGLAALIALVAVIGAATSLVERWQSSRIGEGLIYDLRRTVFEHVQRMPVAFFTRTRTGALVSRLNNDVIGAQRAFTSSLSGLVTNVIQLVLTLVVMLSLSWQVTLLALVLLPAFLLPARRMGTRMAGLEREAAGLNASMTNQMTERFSAPGATLVKLFGRPGAEAAEFGDKAERVRDIGVKTAMATRWFLTGMALLPTVAQAVVYGVGGWLALSGQLAAGTVVSLALLLTRLYTPLAALANARVDIMTALVSFERVFEVLDVRPMIVEAERTTPLPAGAVSVEFDDVRFGYPSADQVSLASLEAVGQSGHPGRGRKCCTASASGPRPGSWWRWSGLRAPASRPSRRWCRVCTTRCRARFVCPDVDVRQLSFDDVRGAVGVVTQDGHLFHDTIDANLRYARPDATDEELWDSIERARLGDLVRSLPDGLETVVGERGYRLSGGERQRLTIARLLLARPRVVILDEATAHLDSESEVAVQAALTEALQGRTALVIAHRLSTIRAADQILVIEDGRVVERGNHVELMAANGRYAELHNTQFREQPSVA